MVDRRPAVIVRCASAEDVPPAIAFARETGLELSVRGGGHHIAGNSVANGGLMIDLSAMKAVRVDAEQRRAWAEPGATLADFDAAVQQHGLATPVGINSTTGISGLTLGGGFGWLSRKYGLTVDNLVSADVVLADGRKLHASKSENADLFWALRGGGGNFGVVTQYEYNLHPLGPEIVAGLIVYPFEQASALLTQYRDFTATVSEELTAWVILREAPPLPFLPPEVHGQMIVAVALAYCGDLDRADELIEPLRGLGRMHGEHVGRQPYAEWQKAFDPMLAPGARNYWKSHNFTQLSDGLLERLVEHAGKLPSPHCEVFLGHLAGAPNRVLPNATAYLARDARFVMNVHARWDDPAQDASCIQWARDLFDACAPFASGGAYVNFMTEDEGGRVAAAYGDNYPRLREIKRKYDPDNVFHLNQNIKP
jgi:FAD/FMN-containing dehydrogenase